MDDILKIIAIIVAIEGLFKALDYFMDKIIKTHDKSQKIEENAETLEEFKTKTNKAIDDLNSKVQEAHKDAADAIMKLEKNLTTALDEQKNHYMDQLKQDKEDYLEGMKSVEQSINETQSVYRKTVAVIDVKIENLEKAQIQHIDELKEEQQKHNNLIRRMYEAESNIKLHNEQIKVANHRIEDLERENAKDNIH